MPITFSVACEDSLWVYRLVLSFQKLKTKIYPVHFTILLKKPKKAHSVIPLLFKEVFCMRGVASAALFRTNANRQLQNCLHTVVYYVNSPAENES